MNISKHPWRKPYWHTAAKNEPKDPSFPKFNQLPPEIRLMIWEAALPSRPDRNAAYVIREYKTRGWPLWGIQRTLSSLSTSCSESLRVTLRYGSLMQILRHRRKRPPKLEYLWINNEIKTLYFCCVSTLDKVVTIPSNIQAIAFHRINKEEQIDVKSFVKRHVGRCNIKTIFIALMWTPRCKHKSITTSLCVNSDMEIVDFDDEMMLEYLTTANEIKWLLDKCMYSEEEIHREGVERDIRETRVQMRREFDSDAEWEEETGAKFKRAAGFVDVIGYS